MTASYLKFFLVFSFLFINGCSHNSAPFHSTSWKLHQQQLHNITHYQVSGKLGYKDPLQTHSTYFTWRQSLQKSELKLMSFLGQTLLTLTIDNNGAKVVTSDGQSLINNNGTRLVQDLTGMALPIESLNDWIKGLPSRANIVNFNSYNTVSDFSQNVRPQTIIVSYEDYQDLSTTDLPLLMPHKIRFTQGNVMLKLAISSWKIIPSDKN